MGCNLGLGEWFGGGALLSLTSVKLNTTKTPAKRCFKGGGVEKGVKVTKMVQFVHFRARSFFSPSVMYWAWSRFSRPILLYISVQIHVFVH